MGSTAALEYAEFNEARHVDELRSYSITLNKDGRADDIANSSETGNDETRFVVSFHSDGTNRVAKFIDRANKRKETFEVTAFREGLPKKTEFMEYDPYVKTTELESVRIYNYETGKNSINRIFTHTASIIDHKEVPNGTRSEEISTEKMARMVFAENAALNAVLRIMSQEDKADLREQGADIPANSRGR